MTRKKVFLIVQSLICALAACLLAAGALCLYFEGSKAGENSPLPYYFSRELAGEKLLAVLPVLGAGLAVTAAGLLRGIRDEKALEPVWDKAARGNREKYTAARCENGRKTAILRWIVAAAAAALIIAGILNGGAQDVLNKGAAICAECIGLG